MTKHIAFSLCAAGLILAVTGCTAPPMTAASTEPVSPPLAVSTDTMVPAPTKVPFELTSPAFAHEEFIPSVHTCRGKNISPQLVWGDPPEGTQSFALIMDDPDGGNWVHWVIYNIPSEARGLPEAVSRDAQLSDGSLQGRNTFQKQWYGGPCPPSGKHRYFFRLYALDTIPDLPAGANKPALEQAMEGHILAQVELMGFFQ
jgi:hypothetical protein